MKISYKSFGCRVNQIELESIIEKFVAKGYSLSLDNYDIIIINSCCVTKKTEDEVLRFIRKERERNPNSEIILTGCLATVFKDEILKRFKDIVIYTNRDKNRIVKDFLGVEDEFFSVNGFYGKTRAFVKIQDGCNLRCSYCIVPFARDIMVSKPIESVIDEIRRLIANGYKEIVISGTRLGAYTYKDIKLKDLLKEIEKIKGNFRIRLSSLEPVEVDEELINILKNSERFCSYFHIPLQSASDDVLSSMKRPYTAKEFAQKVEMIRKNIKDVGIYLDVIVGYPTETDDDFKKTFRFIEDLKFSGLHVFTYSPRPFTKSFELKDLNPKIKKERSKTMHKLDKKLRLEFAISMIGKPLDSISLDRKGEYTNFLTTNFIDVLVKSDMPSGKRSDIKITEASEIQVKGEIC
jgi:threonylcarbamoyladenosine tRNA methylthiotransferase MtaB